MKPALIIIDGPMGSGKTSVAKILQSKIKNCAILSMDVIKKFIYDYHNANKNKRTFAKFEITSIISKAYLKKGISVIIEHSLGDRITINKLVKKSKQKKVKAYVFKIDASLEERIKRIKKRDFKINKKNIIEDSNSFKDKYDYENVFDSSECGPDSIAIKIFERVA